MSSRSSRSSQVLLLYWQEAPKSIFGHKSLPFYKNFFVYLFILYFVLSKIMTKRRCPFEFDLCPQMKIHVGEKELAATNEESMHSIYEKTLMTLKEGSKFFSFGSKNAQGQNKARSSDLCGCCCIIDYNQPSRCNYCDQVMCFQCLVQCTKCSGFFCQNCSLTLYDEDEQSICLSCYK